MKYLLRITLLAILTSCSLSKDDGIDIKIDNNSNESISNIEFTTSERVEFLKINKIESSQSVRDFLSMKKNKTDGEYILSFTRSNGKKEVLISGYYTNGNSLDHWFDVNIEKDTTIIKFDAPIY